MRRLFAADPEDAATGAAATRSPDLASPRARLAAAAVDVTLMVITLFWVGALGFEPAFGSGGPPVRVRLLAWVAVLGHLVLLEGIGGQSFGKRLAGIRVVDAVTGGPIGLATAVHRVGARALFWFVSFLALADPQLQTLHDRSAGTLVLKQKTPAELSRSPERIERID
jgi:uncharacterized RDD family membrane protein YckC